MNLILRINWDSKFNEILRNSVTFDTYHLFLCLFNIAGTNLHLIKYLCSYKTSKIQVNR